MEYIIRVNDNDMIDSDGTKRVEEMHELVRCKDCTQNNQCSIQFKFADADNPGEWFCADGKRCEGH